MKNIVHWRFMDSTIEGTVLSGRELWAMSLHDKIIQRTVDEFYDELMENKVQTLLSCYPKADRVDS